MSGTALLSFDLGQHAGYAWCAGDALYTGIIDVSKCKGDNRHGAMFSAFTAEATRIIREIAPSCVYYEDASQAARRTSAAQSMCWFGLRACLLGVCYELGVPVLPVSTSTYKARAGVPYKCGKDAVRDWCHSRGVMVEGDEADAVAVLNAVLPDHECSLEQFRWQRPIDPPRRKL